ncbi:hypothetical protein C0J52_00598 [Blattella germanica]|nr:hypothetical protein C0J52_00598 [Blattella germanica]
MGFVPKFSELKALHYEEERFYQHYTFIVQTALECTTHTRSCWRSVPHKVNNPLAPGPSGRANTKTVITKVTAPSISLEQVEEGKPNAKCAERKENENWVRGDWGSFNCTYHKSVESNNNLNIRQHPKFCREKCGAQFCDILRLLLLTHAQSISDQHPTRKQGVELCCSPHAVVLIRGLSFTSSLPTRNAVTHRAAVRYGNATTPHASRSP